jgi:aryl-alcohol dehydrogenase-like predicted oxidoreductase
LLKVEELQAGSSRRGVQEVETRGCGTSGLKVSTLGIGCWSFGGGEYWGRQAQADADEVVRRAVELGITYFDTAEVYNEGRSESSLGRAIRGIPRDRIAIGTKINPSNTAPETLMEHCEASLRRLGTDYIDLYMVHWPITPGSIGHFTEKKAPLPSVERAFQTLRELQSQGKVRYIGVSNFAVPKLEQALDTGAEIAVNQLPYSLVGRAIEYEILPLCRRIGIGVIGYMPLWQGLLSDRYGSLDELPVWRRRTRQFDSRKNELARHGEQGAEEETWQAVLAVRGIARELGASTSDLALRWALAAPGVSCVLAGARDRRQLEANAAAAEAELPEEASRRLAEATEPLKSKLGPSIDYYESTANDRTR